MFRKIVLEAFVPDLMARTARSSQACVKELPNITMQLEPRPSLVHRVPDATRGRAYRHLPLPVTVRLLQVRVEAGRGWLLRRRQGDGRSGGMTRRGFLRGSKDRPLRRSP